MDAKDSKTYNLVLFNFNLLLNKNTPVGVIEYFFVVNY